MTWVFPLICLPLSIIRTLKVVQKSTSSAAPKLLDQVRERVRLKHYSIRTEQAYVEWIKRFILFHDKRHPAQMGAAEIEAFLTHLAVKNKVSASTQNQAKSAILFLYREVLDQKLPWLEKVTQAKTAKRLPVVLTVREVQAVLKGLSGTHWLLASLLYGAGLRLMEAVRLRVKDVEFTRREIIVREGKGNKDRVTMLPESTIEPLKLHLAKVKLLHAQDVAAGAAGVYLPFALAKKYSRAGRERRATRDEASGTCRANYQARDPTQFTSLLRHAFAHGRLRHSHGARTAWPQRRANHDDLHPRAQPRRQRRAQPARSTLKILIIAPAWVGGMVMAQSLVKGGGMMKGARADLFNNIVPGALIRSIDFALIFGQRLAPSQPWVSKQIASIGLARG